MKHFLMAFIILSSSFAQASDSNGQVKKRLVTMFNMASSPIAVNSSFEKIRIRTEKKDLNVKHSYEDREFCLNEKFVWSLIPLSTKKLNRMVHANHPRCAKFRVDYYPSLKLPHAKDEFHFDLPYDVSSLNRRKRELWENKRTKVLKDSLNKPYSSLRKVGENSNLTSMEVCAAVALTEIIEDFKADLENDRDQDSIETNNGFYASSHLNHLAIYQTRLKFLALTVGDWYARTKGNSNLCPNFGLELKVSELENRVAQAERKINDLISQNAELRAELERMQRPNYASAAGLLFFGFMGWRTLTPR